MDAVLDLLNEISTPVKIGWVMWLAWGTFQILWYQRTRTPAPIPVEPIRKRRLVVEDEPVMVLAEGTEESSSRKPSASRRAAADTQAVAIGGSPEFLAGLGLLESRPFTPSPSGGTVAHTDRTEDDGQ